MIIVYNCNDCIMDYELNIVQIEDSFLIIHYLMGVYSAPAFRVL